VASIFRLKSASDVIRLVVAIIVIVCAVAFAPRGNADQNPAPADPSLLPVYKQFGEKPGLVTLMDDLMVNLVADPRTRPFFASADQKHIKAELVDQFCVILGGPCEYTGKSMGESHKKLPIDEASFNALVEDLQLAMDKNHIPFRAQNKLLQKLAPMHREIVNKR
jgi:hemoglobin